MIVLNDKPVIIVVGIISAANGDSFVVLKRERDSEAKLINVEILNIETFTGLNRLVAKSSQFTTACKVLRTSDLAKVAIQENRTRHRQKEKSTENRNSNCITVNITSGWLLTLNTPIFIPRDEGGGQLDMQNRLLQCFQ